MNFQSKKTTTVFDSKMTLKTHNLVEKGQE